MCIIFLKRSEVRAQCLLEGINDVQGGVAVTLLDSLDALLIFNKTDDFRAAARLVEDVRFNSSGEVHVFELTIRCVAVWFIANVFYHLYSARLCESLQYSAKARYTWTCVQLEQLQVVESIRRRPREHATPVVHARPDRGELSSCVMRCNSAMC